MSIRKVAEAVGVRCIGLEQMMREIGGFEKYIGEDCDKFPERFPDGCPATYKGENVLVHRMVFDADVFPFYRVVFELGNETLMAGGQEIGTTFHWS